MGKGVTQVNKPVFQCTDGKQFDNESEAVIHQVTVDIEPLLNDYLASKEVTGRPATRIRNSITDWERFKVS